MSKVEVFMGEILSIFSIIRRYANNAVRSGLFRKLGIYLTNKSLETYNIFMRNRLALEQAGNVSEKISVLCNNLDVYKQDRETILGMILELNDVEKDTILRSFAIIKDL